MRTFHVERDEDDTRLDRILRRQFKSVPQSVVQKLCRKGQIRVNGKKASPSLRVKAGDEISFPDFFEDFSQKKSSDLASSQKQSLKKQFEELIIYEDGDVFVINKPSGLAVQGGTSVSHHLDQMLDVIADEEKYRPHLVHRLDRETSGVMVIARNPRAAAFLAKAFKERRVHKRYWAIVEGAPKHRGGFIASDDKNKISAAGPQNALPPSLDNYFAISRYQLAGSCGANYSWLSLSPITGRKHQLRIHCALLGVPICGDKKYAPQPKNKAKKRLSLMLHARHLDMPHPQGGRLEVTAPLPRSMTRMFDEYGVQWGKNDEPRRVASSR